MIQRGVDMLLNEDNQPYSHNYEVSHNDQYIIELEEKQGDKSSDENPYYSWKS